MTGAASRGEVRLAAYVLTLNEEMHVPGAIASLRRLTDAILIIDSCSTDYTAARAQEAGAEVQTRQFDSFEKQRNFALDSLVERFAPDWILSIDADERLSNGLIEEIRLKIVESDGSNLADAYMLPLSVRFGGRALRHGGLSRSRLLRLYRPGSGRYESRSVNEHFALDEGRSLGELTFPIEHCDVVSWERHVAKHNHYSTLEAKERAAAAMGGCGSVSASQALRAPYLRRRWLREQVWNLLPAKPLLRFLQMYVFSCGFLDGGPGFDVALFQAWQEMCTERKFRELMAKDSAADRRDV